jgi:hypothetical protein
MSSLIDGAGDDARDLSAHVAQHLGGRRAVEPTTLLEAPPRDAVTLARTVASRRG